MLATMAVAEAPAGAAAVPSDLGFLGLAGVPNEGFVVYGQVTSPKPKCVAGRKITVTLVSLEGDKVRDTAVSSTHGGWLAHFKSNAVPDIDQVKMVLQKRSTTKGGKTLKCDDDKLAV